MRLNAAEEEKTAATTGLVKSAGPPLSAMTYEESL